MSALGDRIRTETHKAATVVLLEAAKAVHDRAVELMPKGDPEEDPDAAVTLAKSGHIDLSPDGRRATIEFDAPYSAKQHEDRHLKHPRGGGPEYLSNALKEEVPKFPALLAGAVRSQTSRVRDA